MKKELKLLVVLLPLVLNILTSINIPILPCVRATYVEGLITEDTTWTLVDSPYILSNNIVVCPNVTLAIEPKTEVKFGGGFSLTVQGALVAVGAENQPIIFTSDRLEPQLGDWGTIRFNSSASPQLNSVFTNCVVEYGTDGLTVESGSLQIQNSKVRLNYGNGIFAAGGSFAITDSNVSNNGLAGIHISDSCAAIVQDNFLHENGYGIILTGNLTSAISIERNEISLSAQSGVELGASRYDNTVILNNVVLSNHYGFFVSSPADTFITRQYISGNDVGIFYGQGSSHSARYNDIYNNTLGADVFETATANMTQNYWGDRNGPYHESLNPHGKGNPVGGDGVNLDFLFYLTASIDYANSGPTAILWTDALRARPNQSVTFVGADSYDDGHVDQYFYDFGDGNNSGWTTLSLVTYSYSSVGTYAASLRVADDFGSVSAASSTTINVANSPPLQSSVTLSNTTVEYGGQIKVTVYVSDGTNPVENATMTLLSAKGGQFTPQSGTTNSSGYFETTFTAPDVKDVAEVRIIARSNVTGYADGCDFKYLNVLPPLTVQISTTPVTVRSEETAVITVLVTGSFGMPVANAWLQLTCDKGVLPIDNGFTDFTGKATFTFNAPRTLQQLDVLILATASATGYADGQGQIIVVVRPKILAVQLDAEPINPISEATSTVNVHVTCDGLPVSDIWVTVSSDVGSFGTSEATTTSDGNATFLFTAPQTTVPINATVTATATRDGYVTAESLLIVTISPKVFSMEMIATPAETVSEGRVNVTVQVTYDMAPVQDVNITAASQAGGTFSEPWTVTDVNGLASFIFAAPQVNETQTVTIIVYGAKTGYADGEKSTNVTVSPGLLNVQISVSSSILSGSSRLVYVDITCGDTLISDAQVSIVADGGTFVVSAGTTDQNGRCTFVFNAPQTATTLSLTLVANASKFGFADGVGNATVYVNPETPGDAGGGWPWWMMLVIIVPVVIAVIVVVLIKFKIIVVSTGEQS